MYVNCENLGNGIRLVFTCYEGFEEVFDVHVPKDIANIMRLISNSATPEFLMVEVRNIVGISVH